MELTRREIQMALENPANQPRLPAATLARFDAMQLAQVLEREIHHAEINGLSHVGMNMNLTDCAALARALRKAALMGA